MTKLFSPSARALWATSHLGGRFFTKAKNINQTNLIKSLYLLFSEN